MKILNYTVIELEDVQPFDVSLRTNIIEEKRQFKMNGSLSKSGADLPKMQNVAEAINNNLLDVKILLNKNVEQINLNNNAINTNLQTLYEAIILAYKKIDILEKKISSKKD